MGLTGFGVFFLFFGMILFFDKALLAIGNILFVAGLSFVIGLERTFKFFFQRHKFKATSFFLGGVLVVLIGWPIIGVVLEIYGFFLLFRSVGLKWTVSQIFEQTYFWPCFFLDSLLPLSLSLSLSLSSFLKTSEKQGEHWRRRNLRSSPMLSLLPSNILRSR
uniref:Golgi transport 1Bb n=1 Tax=Salmo trutta TaxID=8032 RepID=A0A674CX76_SALTR